MYLNGYSMRITGGHEKASGYVEMKHNSTYSIVLRNNLPTRCDASILVDGKSIGVFRINPYSNITIERPQNEAMFFTFLRLGSKKAKKAGILHPTENLGLITAEFTPEYNKINVLDSTIVCRSTYCNMPSASADEQWDNTVTCMTSTGGAKGMAGASGGTLSAGGTGLSGKSDQKFVQAYVIDKDYSMQTTINLRLICKSKNDIRPLTTLSNKVPPAIY